MRAEFYPLQVLLAGLAGWESPPGTMPTCAERAPILRKATQDALCKHGYLQLRRGRVSTPISNWKADTKA